MSPFARLDLARPVTLTRGTAIMIGVVLGAILGALFYLNAQALQDAADARAEIRRDQRSLAATVARLDALENPTVTKQRMRIDRALDRLTPAQLRRLLRGLLNVASPREREGLRQLVPPRELMPPTARQPRRAPPVRPRPGRGGPPGPQGDRGPQGPSGPPGKPVPDPPPLIDPSPLIPDLPPLLPLLP